MLWFGFSFNFPTSELVQADREYAVWESVPFYKSTLAQENHVTYFRKGLNSIRLNDWALIVHGERSLFPCAYQTAITRRQLGRHGTLINFRLWLFYTSKQAVVDSIYRALIYYSSLILGLEPAMFLALQSESFVVCLASGTASRRASCCSICRLLCLQYAMISWLTPNRTAVFVALLSIA